MSEYDGMPPSYDSWRLRVPPEADCDGSCMIRCDKCQIALAARIPVCDQCESVLWSEHRAGRETWEAVDVTDRDSWERTKWEFLCRKCSEETT